MVYYSHEKQDYIGPYRYAAIRKPDGGCTEDVDAVAASGEAVGMSINCIRKED